MLAIVHCYYIVLIQFDNFLSKVPVFLVFHHVGKYSSLDLFYFVNLTSSCSLIPKICKIK